MGAQDTSPWLPPEAGRPLRAWSRAQLQALGSGLHAVVRDWAAAWAVDDVQAPQVLPLGSGHLDRCAWRALPGAPGTWLGRERQEGADPLARDAGAWARELAALGDADLLRRVVAWLGAASTAPAVEQAPPAEIARPWSGAVVACLGGRAGWRLVLDVAGVGGKVEATAQASRAHAGQPMVPALEALAARPIALRAQLRGSAVDLGLLQTLAPGDVLPLEHRLAEPVRLTGAEGGLALAGYLGRVGRAKAVELAERVAEGA